MKRIATLLLAAAACILPAAAQDIAFSGSQPLVLPHDTFMGSATGVATNSKGHVFVYTRNGSPTITLGGSRSFAHGGSSLYEFGADGKFIRQIGKQVYGFLAAQALRVDAQDNIWAVDRYSSMVIKFHPDGTVAMLLGRKPESVDVPTPNTPPRNNGAGAHQYLFASNTNPYNDLDHGGEITKLELDGRVVGKFGHAGKQLKEFGTTTGIDCRGGNTLYVAEAGNWRVQKVVLK